MIIGGMTEEGGRPGNVRERMRAGEEDNIMRMIIKITMKR